MKLAYTKIKNETPRPHFKIKLSFEHGDADSTTYSENILYTEDEVIAFLEDFQFVQSAIDDRRSQGIRMSEENRQRGDRMNVLEYDVFAEGVPQYYAYPSIESIIFHNGDESFTVAVTV